jgi:hypothetical protein
MVYSDRECILKKGKMWAVNSLQPTLIRNERYKGERLRYNYAGSLTGSAFQAICDGNL